MNISTTDAQGLYTKTTLAVYKERIKPMAFLRGLFPNKVSPSLELSIQVRRGKEKIAVDVQRGSDGNRNQWTRSTEKIFIPPYFREFFDSTDLQLYDRLYGATTIDDAIFAAFINDVVDHQMELQEKIERTYELYCAQVVLTGIVQLKGGINIDFKRQAGSLVDPGAGHYFADNENVFDGIFQDACNWIRTKGKTRGETFDCILGDLAWAKLQGNTVFIQRQNLFNMKLDNVTGPIRSGVGSSYHGMISAGAYNIRLWTYPEFYDDPITGVSTPYIDTKKVVVLPENPNFVFGFAAVPQLIRPGVPPLIGAFVFSDYVDEKKKTHEYHVESAGVPIPVAVDAMFTFKAVA